jgi:6-phosphogluconolactonase
MASNPTIEILPTPAELFQAAAEEFTRVGNTAIATRGRFTVALSGGSTPKSLYSLLAANYPDFAWNQTFLFFGDERHVPPEDADSNYRMVNESLLKKISIRSENVFRVKAENADAAAAAADYNTELIRFFGLKQKQSPRFDLIFLGLGPDGHTASLFPGSEGLKEMSKLVISNWVEKFKTYRISFTYPVLDNAAEVIFLASGPDKADMVKQVLEGDNQPPLPAQQVRLKDGELIWMLDQAAASKLKR